MTDIVVVRRNCWGEKGRFHHGNNNDEGIRNTIISEITHLKLHQTNVCCRLKGIGLDAKRFVIHNVPYTLQALAIIITMSVIHIIGNRNSRISAFCCWTISHISKNITQLLANAKKSINWWIELSTFGEIFVFQ